MAVFVIIINSFALTDQLELDLRDISVAKSRTNYAL